ncbi:MAG: hypothetical protein LBN19_04850 [Endomicrobium sp.]|jgi:hypothetical protein|nr:hypothetical protein [Endomicrobium sp.]
MKKIIATICALMLVTGCASTPFEKYEKDVNKSFDNLQKLGENFWDEMKDCQTASDGIAIIKAKLVNERIAVKVAGKAYLETLASPTALHKKFVKEVDDIFALRSKDVELWLIKFVKLAVKNDMDGIEKLANSAIDSADDKNKVYVEDIFDKYRGRLSAKGDKNIDIKKS